MSKKPNQKTKRAIFLIPLVGFFALAFVALHVLYPYIGINLVSNIFPVLSSTANSATRFYGENIDMSQILPASQHYVVNSKGKDLIDIAADLGINLIRITNDQRSFNNKADSIYTRAQWSQVLGKMESNRIKAIILIETDTHSANYYNPEIQPIYLHLVNEYIDSGVFSNPDVYGVDVKNEPVLTDANIKMLQAAHNMIKAKYPNLKQTIGWWATPTLLEDPYNPVNYSWSNYSAGQKIANIVDFYSIHMYGLASVNLGIGLNPDLRTKVFISEVENGLQTQKPILIEEFGEANGDAVSDASTISSPQLQANVYQGVYQALKEMHNGQIVGAVAFDFYSRNQYPDAWAIVKNNGNYLFPAAYILQEYALGKFNPSLQASTIVTSQSYLMTNADKYTIKSLHISDRIGLKLKLDKGKNYSISLSTNDLLFSIEPFHYDDISHSYYAVYQAKGKGRVQISIVTNVSHTENSISASLIYSLTVYIH